MFLLAKLKINRRGLLNNFIGVIVMVGGIIVERLRSLNKPKVKFYCANRKYEGIILSIDDSFLELHDTIGNYTKFFKIEFIESLEVLE